MTAHEQAVKEEVKDIILDHRGSDNQISSREINDQIGVDDIGSFPTTRAIIRELILEDNIPIASGGNGYFVIETEDELKDYINSLESRMLSIADRKYGIRRPPKTGTKKSNHQKTQTYSEDTLSVSQFLWRIVSVTGIQVGFAEH